MERKEAIEVIKKNWPDSSFTMLREALETLIPELAESEDEKIRKDLLYWLYSYKDGNETFVPAEDVDVWITYLEKQGEQQDHSKFLDSIQIGDQVTKNEDGVLVNLSQLKRVAKTAEKQGEQKPTNNIEPKFKVGDWISGYYTNYKVLSVNNEGYVVEDVDGNKINILFENEKFHHLWTIQDAKNGDVLVHNNCVFIFMGIKNGIVQAIEENFLKPVSFGEPDKDNDYYPATKEQRDLLLQKIKKAGYEWNADKKELKKVEQKPEWSEEDKRIYKSITYSFAHNYPLTVQQQEFVKFLRPQNTWKPSDESMIAINTAINVIGKGTLNGKQLIELQEQLKKLREK